MITRKAQIATVVAAFALLGCKSSPTTSAASAGDGAGSTPSSATQVAYVQDPTLNNMNAVAVTIPAGWKFQSALFQGGNCATYPYAVWRATSADGQSLSELMPAMGWVWGTGPMLSFWPQQGCLPLNGPMTAQQFLVYLAKTMNVNYVADAPVPPALNAAAQQYLQQFDANLSARHVQAPKQSSELAMATVSYTKGATPMQGNLLVEVDCTQNQEAGMQTVSAVFGQGPRIVTGAPTTVNQCVAAVAYLTGPQTQFAALLQQWMSQGLGMNGVITWRNGQAAWINAWSNRQIAATQRIAQQMNAAAAAQRQAQQQQFNQSMAIQQQIHNQFLAGMLASTNASMANANAAMNARSTVTSDWVDFALDQKTVMNTNNGQVFKTSNQTTTGGGLQQVHGNGTP